MSATSIRCENDLKMALTLVEDRTVVKASEELERLLEKQTTGTRRHLLATSVRLSPAMAPGVHKMARHCGDALGLEMPLELYVYSSPQYNAACFKPEDGRLFIMFSSSLLEAFSDEELMFVMGHELGHHVYNHHEIPIGFILRGESRPPASLAMKLFAWSRYAEFSADRAGAFCAQDMHAVARALFKLASGLSSDRMVQFSLDDFLQQVEDMIAVDAVPGKSAPMADWFSTHPFSPMRVKALTCFHDSELMTKDGFSKDELEVQVQDIMKLMEPGYMEAQTRDAKVMRNLFIAAAVTVANADGEFSDAEKETLKQFFEEGFNIEKLDSDRLTEMLPQRMKEAREETTLSQRMQVIRDLSLVATAEERVSAHEEKVLFEIARELQIACDFVRQSLDQSAELD